MQYSRTTGGCRPPAVVALQVAVTPRLETRARVRSAVKLCACCLSHLSLLLQKCDHLIAQLMSDLRRARVDVHMCVEAPAAVDYQVLKRRYDLHRSARLGDFRAADNLTVGETPTHI